jgi:hypothetical protein
MANDETAYTLLKGEAVLSRQAVRNIGGESGLRKAERGSGTAPQVIVLQPFKHFDRFVNARTKRTIRKAAQGGY